MLPINLLSNIKSIEMNSGFFYFRIKMQWKGVGEDGSIVKKKTEDLVYATSYTEAEKIAYALIESESREAYEPIFSLEITKVKMEDLIYNDTLESDTALVGGMVYSFFKYGADGEGFYNVYVITITIDERTAKEKMQRRVFFVPAQSNADATAKILKYLPDADVIVRDVKFDNAQSILLPQTIYQQKVNENS